MAIWTPQHRPSWKQGFARGPAEARYPGLWKGLVGAWFPSLGPTGLTLRDISGRGNHGTLTSMDPATDWVVTEKGYALDFDGTNDYVNLGVPKVLTAGVATLSCFCWFRTANLAADQRTIWASPTVANNTFGIWMDTDEGADGWACGVWDSADASTIIGTTTASAIANQFQHVGFTSQQGKVNGQILYVDGSPVAQANARASLQVAQVLMLARVSNSPNYGAIQVLSADIWDRVLSPNEIQLLYEEPDALVMQRQRVYPAAVAAVGYTVPLSHILENSA